MTMNIAVTGGAGFIGSNVARYLQEAGHSVVAIDSLALGRADNLPPKIPLVVGDAGSPSVWNEVPDVDLIVHLAGASSTPMFDTDLSGAFGNNVLGFLNVLKVANARGVNRVIYASSSLIYGNVPPPLTESGPVDNLNFYSLSKFCMEHIARMYHADFGLECVGLRFMSVYGPREEHKGRMANLVSQFIWDIAAGRKPVVYGDGRQTRDFTSVWDVAQIVRRIAECPHPLGTRVFNVGSGVATSLNELVAMLSKIMDVSVEPKYIPVPRERRAYNLQQQASVELAARELGFRPGVSLSTGIREILAQLVAPVRTGA
jgi:nucleoside-diphosphate-sugar epimerase